MRHCYLVFICNLIRPWCISTDYYVYLVPTSHLIPNTYVSIILLFTLKVLNNFLLRLDTNYPFIYVLLCHTNLTLSHLYNMMYIFENTHILSGYFVYTIQRYLYTLYSMSNDVPCMTFEIMSQIQSVYNEFLILIHPLSFIHIPFLYSRTLARFRLILCFNLLKLERVLSHWSFGTDPW